MARVVVTGASGFIGRHLVPVLSARGHAVVEAGRRARDGALRFVAIGEIDGTTDWNAAVEGAEAVVHLAGLAHREDARESEHFAVNDAGMGRLVAACEAADVRTVVLLSSIAARQAAQTPERAGAYGRSKLAGEGHVRRFAEAGKGAGIVLRPPLVYGYDAPGNWRRLQRLAATSLPLPFGAVDNRRSLCSVGNLCDAIAAAVAAGIEGAGSGTYEIADREQVSLAQILTWLRAGMGRPCRLLPVPPGLLRLAARAARREKQAAALLDDLVLDPSDFTRAFGWHQPETAEEAIIRSGRLFAGS